MWMGHKMPSFIDMVLERRVGEGLTGFYKKRSHKTAHLWCSAGPNTLQSSAPLYNEHICTARHINALDTTGNTTKGAVSVTAQVIIWPGGKAHAKQVMPTISATGVQGRESSRYRRDQGRLLREERTGAWPWSWDRTREGIQMGQRRREWFLPITNKDGFFQPQIRPIKRRAVAETGLPLC